MAGAGGHPDPWVPPHHPRDVSRCSSPPADQCSLNNGGCSHNCTVAPGEGIVCSCPLGMELGTDNRTCQIQSYCAKHLKCSQKCEQDKFNVKCSCYEGWMLEPDGESCRSLGTCSAGHPVLGQAAPSWCLESHSLGAACVQRTGCVCTMHM